MLMTDGVTHKHSEIPAFSRLTYMGYDINLWAPCVLYIGQASRYSPENAFIYLINKYISLFDICLTVHH